MVKYSHSKLSTFEQCPLKFKYKYIDKIIVIEETIEAFLGKIVHETLEWLYKKAKQNEIPGIEEVIIHYKNIWENKFREDIKITREDLTKENYFNKGIEFLAKYYSRNYPFNENTIALEKKIEIDLDEQGDKKIIGFIDRLTHNLEKDELEIHDYKTANSLPTKEKIQEDRQLALYSLAIKEEFGKEKNVCLVWHYLAHDTKICIRKREEELEKLKREVQKLIEEIESTTNFPPIISKLCNWCEYRHMCPAWQNYQGNNKKEKQKEIKEFEENKKKNF